MTIPDLVIYLVLVFIGALVFTGCIRKYSLKYSILDIPTERSSHIHPTPRGGGLSITLCVLITVMFIYHSHLIAYASAVALAGGGFVVAGIGWLDDHYDLSPGWRALGYLAASVWALYWVMGTDISVYANYILSLVAIVSLVWLINLYNFMDGTDALAAIEAISAGIFSGVLFFWAEEKGLAIISLSVAAAAAGFLYWNRPPAKIFMGDVGSCFIGFTFGVLALLGARNGAIPLTIWIILLSVFICDATFTLIMRIINRERWYAAHRSHAYQRLVQMNISHSKLALYVLGLNIVFLWPLAYIAFQWKEYSFYVTLLVVLIMYILWAVVQGCHRKHITGQT